MRKGRTETERPQRNSLRDERVLLISFTRSSVAGFLYALSRGANQAYTLPLSDCGPLRPVDEGSLTHLIVGVRQFTVDR